MKVYAQQFAWTFQYPGYKDVSLPNLYLVKGQSVKLTLRSRDVIHSFWVPQFRQKQDLLPDQDTQLVITPTHDGRVPGRLHGALWARPRDDADARDRLSDPGRFASLHEARRTTPQKLSGGRRLHRPGLRQLPRPDARRSRPGKIGPDLDYLAAYAKRAGKPVDAFIKESILDPPAYVEPGLP